MSFKEWLGAGGGRDAFTDEEHWECFAIYSGDEDGKSYSCQEIADKMNAKGIFSKNGKPQTADRIYNHLRHYLGNFKEIESLELGQTTYVLRKVGKRVR